MTESEKRIIINGSEITVRRSAQTDSLTCGFLGPRGTYGEQAARGLLRDQAELIQASTNVDIIKKLSKGETDLGLIPIENSTEGNVTESVRGLIHGSVPVSSDIRILAETALPINHILYGTQEAFDKKIIRSHPQALGQCSQWINERLQDATVVRETSTSEAVRIATERNELSIGTKLAGEIYNAPIFDDDIMDLKTNHTRFWLLGQGETTSTGKDRTTLVYTLKNIDGALVRALLPFSLRGIGINKIDTLPLGTLDEYYFLMSVDGHEKDEKVAEALAELKKSVWKSRVLGSFQKSLSRIVYDPEARNNGWIDPTVL